MHSPRSFLLFLVAAAVLLSCTGRPQPSASDPKAAPHSETQPPSERPYKTVEVDSLDGTPLIGSYYAAGNPDSPAVLLLHQWESNRHAYDDFAVRMQSHGFAVLAIDGRGFGESNRRANGAILTPGRTDADVKLMLGDVDATFGYLTKQQGVDPRRVGIVGASYGSSLAIIYAADHPNVAAVALLSPGLNYFGNMQTEPAAKKYGERPLFITAAEDDKESADAVRSLSTADAKATHKIYSTGGHGTALLKVGVADELEKFLSSSLQR